MSMGARRSARKKNLMFLLMEVMTIIFMHVCLAGRQALSTPWGL